MSWPSWELPGAGAGADPLPAPPPAAPAPDVAAGGPRRCAAGAAAGPLLPAGSAGTPRVSRSLPSAVRTFGGFDVMMVAVS